MTATPEAGPFFMAHKGDLIAAFPVWRPRRDIQRMDLPQALACRCTICSASHSTTRGNRARIHHQPVHRRRYSINEAAHVRRESAGIGIEEVCAELKDQ